MYIQLMQFNPAIPDKTKLKNIKLVKRPGVNNCGVNEMLDVVDLTITFINSLINVYSNGKLNVSDIQYLFEPLLKTPKTLSNMDKIPMDVSELSNEKIEVIVERVREELCISSTKAIDIVQYSIDWVYSTYNLLNTIKE